MRSLFWTSWALPGKWRRKRHEHTPLSASGSPGGGRRTGGGGAGDQPQGSGRDGRLGVRRAGRLLVAVEEAGEVSGEFRRSGGEFLSGCPERNQRSTRARLRMSAPRSYSPPLDPILRGSQLSGLGSR